MDTEQRKAAILNLIEDAEKRAAGIGPSCYGCRYSRNADYTSISECRSPVARLKGMNKHGKVAWPTLNDMRDGRYGDEGGLCGPEALLFERRTWHYLMFWTAPTMPRQFLTAPLVIVGFLFIFIWTLSHI